MSAGPAPAARPIRTALVGYGMGGEFFHAPFIEATEGLALDAIVTRDAGRSASARARHPRARIVDGFEDVLAMADRLDLVVVTTPNRTHAPLALAALEAGLDVVVDKPLAVTAADARRLVEAAERHERMLTVYQNRRRDGDFLTLRHLIDAGALGTVHRFESRFERWRRQPKEGWRQDPAGDAGGGLLFDLGAHLIDQALALFGPVREVYAELDERRPGAAVDDDAFVALTHESGVRSHLWMNVIAARPAPRLRVLGSRATWTKHGMDPQERQLRELRMDPRDAAFGVEPADGWGLLDDGADSRLVPTARGDYLGFYRDVVRALRGHAPPPVDPRDAVASLEIIEAARAAAG